MSDPVPAATAPGTETSGTEPASSEPAIAEPASTEPSSTEPANSEPASSEPSGGRLRVTSLELFFDLVFAFTLTQLTAVLDGSLTFATAGRVLLVFVLLWWMYGGYAWLTNARPPVHTAERILMLVGMAGFLIVGLAIPRGFGGDGVVLGLGYLLVVVVHSCLFYRVNAQIIRVAPFNISSALLVIIAGLAGGPARYPLWVAALAIQLGSPLIVHPGRRFQLDAGHLSKRHSGLLIVALGESVAAIGIGASALAGRPEAPVRLAASAVLGLALAAALWWVIFGSSDEERGERALAHETSERRSTLALTAHFYSNIPILIGLIAMAAGVQEAIADAGATVGRPAAAAFLAVGAALFLAGDVAVRRVLRIGSVRLRSVAAVVALTTTAAGAFVGLDVQLVLVTVILVAMLLAEQRWDAMPASDQPAGDQPAGDQPARDQPAGDQAAGADAAG
jgi:low temperature requirement protein LtrA